MPSVEFGTRDDARAMRDRLGPFLASDDDARTSTLKLKPSAPDSLIERVEGEAFESERDDRKSAGMTKLSTREKQHLKRQYDSFSWKSHGFEAMRSKAEAQRQGATEWLDFFEPGEGAAGVTKNLRSSKDSAARRGAGIGVGGDYTDEEEMDQRRRVRRQSEKVSAESVDRAKEPAFGGDSEAIGFLREESLFNDSLFGISFRGERGPSGRDYDRLRDAHESRSKQARTLDERRSAKVTRDPLKWAENKGRYDFPGIDTVEPDRLHKQRSKRARTVDERTSAPLADSREQWASNPSRYDWKGVDTPDSNAKGGLFGGGGDWSFDDPGELFSSKGGL